MYALGTPHIDNWTCILIRARVGSPSITLKRPLVRGPFMQLKCQTLFWHCQMNLLFKAIECIREHNKNN